MGQAKAHLVNLPARVDSAVLAKHQKAGEAVVLVKVCGVHNLTPYEYRGHGSRSFIFRWDLKISGHVLRVPAHVWMQDNHRLAHDLLEHRSLPHPIVVLFELPAPVVVVVPAEPISQPIVSEATVATPVTDEVDSISIPQGASEAGGAHNAPEAGSTPAPETILPEPDVVHPGSLHTWREFKLHEAIAELVKEGAVRLGDVCEKFEATEQQVREAIEFAPNLTHNRGWVKLTE